MRLPSEPPSPQPTDCGDEEFRFSAGPYLLGALATADREAFERHLAHCPGCRAQVDRLAPVVDLLGRVPASDAALLLDEDDAAHPGSAQDPPRAAPVPEGPVPDTLLDRLLASAARQRRRRTVLATVGALAAAAIVALLVVLVARPSTPAPQATGQVVAMTAEHGSMVSATATVTGMPWGTQIVVHCRYPAAPPNATTGYGPAAPPPVFTLRVVDTSGTAHSLGSWSLGAGKDAVFTAGTAVPLRGIGRIEVLRADGTTILTAAG